MKRLAAMQLWPLFWLRARDRDLDGGVDVGVGEHDERIGAAQLEHLLLEMLAGRAGDVARRRRSSRSA